MEDLRFYKVAVNDKWFYSKDHKSTNWMDRDKMLVALREQLGAGEYMIISLVATRATHKPEIPVYRVARPCGAYLSSPESGISLWATKQGGQYTKTQHEMMTGEVCTLETWAASVTDRAHVKV